MSSGNDFNFCPMCGGKNISYLESKKWYCSDCGFDLYNNVAAAVGVVIFDKAGNILLEKRAKEPRRGYLAFPGGFCSPDETAETAVLRECSEETGFMPENCKYLCSFPNTYEYRNILYKTCDMFFSSEIPDEIGSVESLIKKLHGQKSEVSDFCSVRVNSEDDIKKLPLAFDSARKTLTVWLNERKIK